MMLDLETETKCNTGNEFISHISTKDCHENQESLLYFYENERANMLAKDVTRRPFTLNISKSYTYTLELFLFQKKKKIV